MHALSGCLHAGAVLAAAVADRLVELGLLGQEVEKGQPEGVQGGEEPGAAASVCVCVLGVVGLRAQHAEGGSRAPAHLPRPCLGAVSTKSTHSSNGNTMATSMTTSPRELCDPRGSVAAALLQAHACRACARAWVPQPPSRRSG